MPTTETGAQLHMAPRLVDFHSHYYESEWYPFPRSGSSVLSRTWPLLTDIEAQVAAMDEAGIDAKVLSAPPALFGAPGARLADGMMERINDRFAALVDTYPERLLALASVDAFEGDAAAREVERAVGALGLGGVCVDCARGDRFLDAPETRPVLEAAVAFGAPVFVHPVSPAGFTERLAAVGHTGILLARGTETAASVLAMLRAGVFDALPTLTVVVPMIAVAALAFAGIAEQERGDEERWVGASPGMTRRRLYMDTMGFDPASIRFAVELLGAEHVLLGSDWPIMPIVARPRIEAALASAGLTGDESAAVLGGNAARLLARHDALPR